VAQPAARHGRPAPDREAQWQLLVSAIIMAIGCSPAEGGRIDPDSSVRFWYHNNLDLSSEK